MRRIVTITLTAALVAGPGTTGPAAGQTRDFVPVGVRYVPDPDPKERLRDLEAIRKLRFNVIAIAVTREVSTPGDLLVLDRLLESTDARLPSVAPAPQTIVLRTSKKDAADVTIEAWAAIAHGAGGVVFDDWTALQQSPQALAAAADFADAITRNAALYAPLRPGLAKTGIREVRVERRPAAFEAHLLESPDAMVLIALNHADTADKVTIEFAREMPEAIWQNMLTGGAVNFVAGPDGPTYTRTCAPKDVLVLMIRKRWR
jgi:hypothetical protein